MGVAGLSKGGDVGNESLTVRLGGGADEAGELEDQHQDQAEECGDGHGKQGAEGDADGGEQGEDEREPGDEEPRHGARAERDRKALAEAFARGLRRADVRAHRNEHADIAGCAREERPGGEAERLHDAERKEENCEDDDACDQDRRILPVEVGLRAFLDRRSDFPHPIAARRQRHHLLNGERAVQNREPASRDDQQECCAHVVPSLGPFKASDNG